MNPAFSPPPGRAQQGFTIVELMIAMVLGLIVIGGVASVVMANSQTYRTNTALAQVQENARTAFELLARDLREAGATGCGNQVVTNVLNGGGGDWFDNWTGIRGFNGNENADIFDVEFGTDTADRANGTDAIMLQGAGGTGYNVVQHNTSAQGGGASNFQINASNHPIARGDLLMVCDPDRAVIFQVTDNPQSQTIGFNTGNSVTPGNCSKYLNPGSDPNCGGGQANPPFGPNSQLMLFNGAVWYIGHNGRPEEGGLSLFRQPYNDNAQEMIPGVSNMQLRYRASDSATDFIENPSVWEDVTAVEATLTFTSMDTRVTTSPDVNDGRLERSFTTIVGLRNRAP